jgi:hypothetical protein
VSAVRFFTDEDMAAVIAVRLRTLGFDAISTPEANRRGSLDEDQLSWAAHEGRAIITCNASDFASLHTAWLASGRSHAGIIIARQGPAGMVLRQLQNLAATLDAAAMIDRLEFLSNW